MLSGITGRRHRALTRSASWLTVTTVDRRRESVFASFHGSFDAKYALAACNTEKTASRPRPNSMFSNARSTVAMQSLSVNQACKKFPRRTRKFRNRREERLVCRIQITRPNRLNDTRRNNNSAARARSQVPQSVRKLSAARMSTRAFPSPYELTA